MINRDNTSNGSSSQEIDPRILYVPDFKQHFLFFIRVRWTFNSSNYETHDDWKNYWDLVWVRKNQTQNIISQFPSKKCSREDFQDLNATDVYDNLDTLDPIDKVY